MYCNECNILVMIPFHIPMILTFVLSLTVLMCVYIKIDIYMYCGPEAFNTEIKKLKLMCVNKTNKEVFPIHYTRKQIAVITSICCVGICN